MDAAKMKRTSAKGQFTRYETRLKSLLREDDVDTWTLNKRYNDLKDRWEKVQDAHEEYTMHLTESDDKSEAEEWIDELASKFDEVELGVGKMIKNITRDSPPADTKSQDKKDAKHAGYSAQSIVKIEKIKFQTFEGNIRKFPEFKEEFIKHIQPQCNGSQLAIVLKGYLSDTIRDEVSNVSNDYNKMWERLDQKYGNVGKLVDAILYDVKRLSRSSNTNSDVLQMINVVEKAKRDLESLGEEAELHNSTTISIIEQSMKAEMMHEWVKLIASKHYSSRQKFTALLEFLQDWRTRLEYMGASIREDQDHSSGDTYHVGRGSRPENPRCWLHNLDGEAGGHPIWRCKLFTSNSIQERINLVKINKACQACLNTGCSGVGDAQKCSRGFKCKATGCGAYHHSYLHANSGGLVHHANEALGNPSGDAILPTQKL